MDLSRLASIHKSIRAWEEALKEANQSGLPEKPHFQLLLNQLKKYLAKAWEQGKVEPADLQQIVSLKRDLDRLFDECRLLG